MNKKYKLLKDSPTAKAGCVYFHFIPGIYKTNDSLLGAECLPAKVVENNPEWFEEAKMEVPNYRESYFFISDQLNIEHTINVHDPIDIDRIKNNNYFKTEEEAKEAKNQILEILSKLKNNF